MEREKKFNVSLPSDDDRDFNIQEWERNLAVMRLDECILQRF